MIRYCDIHGATEVPDGPPNQFFKCNRLVDTGQGSGQPCNTVLKEQPRVQVGDAQSTQNPTSDARAGRSDKLLHQAGFLAAYGKLGNISKASEAAEISRSQHYEWMEDAEYERRFLDAHQLAIQSMVDRAQEIAFGQAPDTRLIVKFLESVPRHMMPKGWDFNPARRQELSGPGGGPIETNELNARDALSSRIASLTTPTDTPSGS